jgi:N-carbamoylputrescine amidase
MSGNNNSLRIGLIQTKSCKTKEEIFKKTKKLAAKAASKGAKIACLQELFSSSYFAQTKDKANMKLSETIPGVTSDFLKGLAKECKITLVGGSIFEKDGGKHYNTSLIIDKDGNIAAKYRKIHIPHDPKYYEQFYFSSGNLGYVQAKVSNVKIAPLICYDQWFPEAARANVLNGAQILFYPTAIGWSKEMSEYEPFSKNRWENAMCSHASLNGVYVACVNRVGKEDGLNFWGGSFVADPFGEVISRASEKDEEILVTDIGLSKIEESQQGWGFLRNRQVKSYGDLVK